MARTSCCRKRCLISASGGTAGRAIIHARPSSSFAEKMQQRHEPLPRPTPWTYANAEFPETRQTRDDFRKLPPTESEPPRRCGTSGALR